VLILFGAVHLLGELSGPPPPQDETARNLFHLLQTYALDLAGTKRTMSDLLHGYSVMMSAQSIALGIIGWLIVPDRSMCTVYGVACLTFTAVSVVYFFFIPTSFVAIAFAFFAAASFRR